MSKVTKKKLLRFNGGPFNCKQALFNESCVQTITFSLSGQNGFYKRNLIKVSYDRNDAMTNLGTRSMEWVEVPVKNPAAFVQFITNSSKIPKFISC